MGRGSEWFKEKDHLMPETFYLPHAPPLRSFDSPARCVKRAYPSCMAATRLIYRDSGQHGANPVFFLTHFFSVKNVCPSAIYVCLVPLPDAERLDCLNELKCLELMRESVLRRPRGSRRRASVLVAGGIEGRRALLLCAGVQGNHSWIVVSQFSATGMETTWHPTL